MGQRSNYKKIARDFYKTPEHAIQPLLPHLPEKCSFDEPCAGDRALVNHLIKAGHWCEASSDIEPRHKSVIQMDVFDIPYCNADMFITNPPYTWAILNPLITHLSNMAKTWLLLPAAMAHNKRMAAHLKKCVKIVSVGRVKWFNNKAGMEDSVWMLFDKTYTRTQFFGRE